MGKCTLTKTLILWGGFYETKKQTKKKERRIIVQIFK